MTFSQPARRLDATVHARNVWMCFNLNQLRYLLSSTSSFSNCYYRTRQSTDKIGNSNHVMVSQLTDYATGLRVVWSNISILNQRKWSLCHMKTIVDYSTYAEAQQEKSIRFFQEKYISRFCKDGVRYAVCCRYFKLSLFFYIILVALVLN